MAKKKQECSTCGYWVLEYDLITRNQLPKGDKLRGQCLAALEIWAEDSKLAAMVTADGSCYMAVLLTKPDHYCKEYKL